MHLKIIPKIYLILQKNFKNIQNLYYYTIYFIWNTTKIS